jgi:hypothetical protein
METFIQFLNTVLPASIVLFGMYLIVKSFLEKDFQKKLVEIKLKSTETILPIRLQAYERVCLLLERLSPANLVPRINDQSYNAAVFHKRLIMEVREEFNHNLSQQVYMSDNAWNVTKAAINDLNSILNAASGTVDPEAKGIELAKNIFERYGSLEQDPIATALTIVKDEIRQFY